MKFKIAIFLLYLPLIFQISYQEKVLKKLIEVARHGARSPFFPYVDAIDWGIDLQQLTSVGERHHFLLGKQMRIRYIDELKFLSPQFNRKEIKILSRTVTRSIQSAQAQMLGLYQQTAPDMQQNWQFQAETDVPPLDIDPQFAKEILDQINIKNLPDSFQPVPMYVFPNNYENIIMDTSKSCKRIEELRKENELSIVYYKFEMELKQSFYYDNFRTIFNISRKTPVDMLLTSRYFDTLFSDVYQQRPLPQKLDENFYEKMKFVYDFRFLYCDFGSELNIKLQNTKLIYDMLNFIQNGTQKFLFYSGSDNHVNGLNIIFNVVQYQNQFDKWKQDKIKFSNAGFASNIFIEIYQDDQTSKQYARYIYNGIAQTNWGDCKQEFCDLDIVISNFLQWTITNEQFNYECNLKQ